MATACQLNQPLLTGSHTAHTQHAVLVPNHVFTSFAIQTIGGFTPKMPSEVILPDYVTYMTSHDIRIRYLTYLTYLTYENFRKWNAGLVTSIAWVEEDRVISFILPMTTVKTSVPSTEWSASAAWPNSSPMWCRWSPWCGLGPDLLGPVQFDA